MKPKRVGLLVLLLYSCFCIFTNLQAINIKGNKSELRISIEDSLKVDQLLLEANVLRARGEYSSAIEKAKDAQLIAEKYDFTIGRYRVYNLLEDLYNADGNKILAKKYKLKSYTLKSKIDEINEKNKRAERDRLLLKQQQVIEKEQAELKKRLSEIESLNTDKSISKQELEKRKQEILAKQNELNSQLNTIAQQKQTITQTTAELDVTKQLLENARLTKKILDDSLQMARYNEELVKNDLEKQSLLNYLLILGLSVFLIISVAIYRLYYLRKSNQKILENKNIEIAKEKERSDNLLLNILPENVANELKNTGKAEPKFFERSTIMFTDFVGFTKVSSSISPKELVEEIDTIFRQFDAIIEKYKIEKIKTIGDAYLCVSGVPDIASHSALNVVHAAREIIDFLANHTKERKEQNRISFDIRIGIHSGPIVAGIVGVKKFAYDIWGDTVNTAARMEQNSEAGKINISGVTYELIKNEIECEYRGKIAAKNKGEIDMYFIK